MSLYEEQREPHEECNNEIHRLEQELAETKTRHSEIIANATKAYEQLLSDLATQVKLQPSSPSKEGTYTSEIYAWAADTMDKEAHRILFNAAIEEAVKVYRGCGSNGMEWICFTAAEDAIRALSRRQ